MDNPKVKVLLLVALVVALGAGALAGGAGMYALTRSGGMLPAAKAQAGDAETGVIVSAVQSPGPAKEAGVVRGDIIQAIDGNTVNQAKDLQSAIAEHKPGDVVRLQVLHGDEVRTFEVTLGDSGGKAQLGVALCGASILDALPRTVSAKGFVIREVVADSPAEKAGLQAGDVIIRVAGKDLSSDWTLAQAIGEQSPGDTVSLDIQRQDEEMQLSVVLGENPDKAGAPYLGVTYATAFGRGVLGDWTLPEGSDLLPRMQLPPAVSAAVDSGVFVGLLEGDSPARTAGITNGDIISAVDGDPVASPEELTTAIRAHKPGDTVVLSVCSAPYDQVRDVQVTLGENPDEAGVAFLGVRLAGSFSKSGGDMGPRFNWTPRQGVPRGFPWGSGQGSGSEQTPPLTGREA